MVDVGDAGRDRPTGPNRPDRRDSFPAGFFGRADESDDGRFYEPVRLVTHIDEGAISAVGALYRELGLGVGESSPVLDLMSSWVSHFLDRPDSLTVLGMNQTELDANPMADERVVQDLNRNPILPFGNSSFGSVVCCVSVDYLARPFEVFDEVARILRPGAPLVCTFSNRCFPTKAIQGWLAIDDAQRCALVAEYFRRARRYGDNGDSFAAFDEPTIERRTPNLHRGDPLYAVWANAAAGRPG